MTQGEVYVGLHSDPTTVSLGPKQPPLFLKTPGCKFLFMVHSYCVVWRSAVINLVRASLVPASDLNQRSCGLTQIFHIRILRLVLVGHAVVRETWEALAPDNRDATLGKQLCGLC